MARKTVRLPSISETEALLISLLGGDERFGLNLVETSGGRLKRGTIYVTLSRMEAKGFVTSRQEERPAGAVGLPRRLYRVTAYGHKVHQAWLLLRDALTLRNLEAHS